MKTLTLTALPSLAKGKKDIWKFFDSPADLADNPLAEYSGKDDQFFCEKWGDNQWAGGSMAQARKWARNGQTDCVAASDKLVQRFERECASLLSQSKPIIPAVCGGAWNIPAVFAGHPMAARTRSKVQSNSAPLTIVACVTFSASYGPDVIRKRGAAVLALARLLSRSRAVSLYALFTSSDTAGNASFLAVKLDSQPLDLARASFALAEPSFSRRLCFAAIDDPTPSMRWPYHRGVLTIEQQETICARVFKGDLLSIPGCYSGDPLIDDPTKWLKETLVKHT